MATVYEELAQVLSRLEPDQAQALERLVRDALALAEQSASQNGQATWPADYFEKTAGALAGEEFERPEQGPLPRRDDW
jgi:hypothetical protein